MVSFPILKWYVVFLKSLFRLFTNALIFGYFTKTKIPFSPRPFMYGFIKRRFIGT